MAVVRQERTQAKPPMPALYRSRQEYERRSRTLAASGLGPQRTVKQIKKIWENMRSRAKKFVSDQKKKLCRTGGGPPSPVVKPDPVLEKILALIADELELDPNHNDSDRWPTDVTVVVIINEKGEQLDEPMAMTEQPSTACSVPILLMPTRGNDSAPAACTSFVESSGTAALLYSPAIHSTPLPLTSKDVRGTVVSSSSSSNHCTPLSSTSVEVPATVASICSTPLPSTSVLASVPVTFPSELSPIQSSSARGKVSGKKFKAEKRQVEDSVGRESYEMLSKFQKEEHEIVMQIHKQNLENKKMEGDCLCQAMKIMSSIHSRVEDTGRCAWSCRCICRFLGQF
ncbi:uncharacterized protein LOC135093307 isoform X1 [Scylla paramamosain]|uniref:uncharacterized protein LOC135093307 isoform X1 n=1 Tax=Scylla paramamosain TaxID=85552 RepID=UPI0030832C7A